MINDDKSLTRISLIRDAIVIDLFLDEQKASEVHSDLKINHDKSLTRTSLVRDAIVTTTILCVTPSGSFVSKVVTVAIERLH